jgi:hypothetical protein
MSICHNGINEGCETVIQIKSNQPFGLYGEGLSNIINEWGELEESAEIWWKESKAE